MKKTVMKVRTSILLSLVISVTSCSNYFTVFALESESVKSQTSTVTQVTNYSDLFNKLTTLINERVGNNSSFEVLNTQLKDADFAKAIVQRELLSKADSATFENFITIPRKKAFVDWLLNNTEAMNLFLEGGKPDTEYSKAFDVWFEIWDKDMDSHIGYELKLAIACAMKFGNGVPKWYTSRTLVTPYERYEYFKVREKEGKFPISMKTRSVWELRSTIAAPVSNWDLDYVRETIHAGRYNEDNKKVAIWYPPYTSKSIYKDENGNPYSVFGTPGDKFFGPDATIREVHKIGGVCGTASMFGSIALNSFGIPGFLVGQPGHAAHVYHSPNSSGSWDIGYDVSGWGYSKHNSSTVVPYTNYSDIINRVAYWFAYESSRKDEEVLHKSFQFKWIADALSDYASAQAIRKNAIEFNKWNIDIWRDYINAMKNTWNQALEDTKIPSSKITVAATNSNKSYLPEYAIDGKNNTFWHTEFTGQGSKLPQSITLTFDKAYEINKLSYLPRPAGGSRNGNITEFNLYGSTDGKSYQLISHGTFTDDFNKKIIEFAPISVKALKLEAVQGNGNYAAAAELNVYRMFNNKPITQEEWDKTAYSIINDLKEQPEVVFDLFRSIQGMVLNSETSREKYQQFVVDLRDVLDKASTIDWKQKQITEYLSDNMPNYGIYMSDFNFDGDNAGRLMGSKTDTEYSLDGGKTWKHITEENMKLNAEELASITSEYGIRIRLIGSDSYVLIPIKKAPSLPKIYVNDDLNKIFNINTNVYYSIDGGANWTKYNDEETLPDLSKDLKFMVKIPAQGKTLGSETQIFEFSSKTDKTLILPSEILSVNADADKNNPVKNVYDGNIYSFWHTSYTENVKPLPQAITFELKNAYNINKLEYVPRQDNHRNGNILEFNIYASENGEDYMLVSNGKWQNDNNTKTVSFNAPNAKFIKLEALKGDGNYASAAEIKLFKTDNLVPYVNFSFDGENKGKLVGTNTSMEYSMDGGSVWKNITQPNMQLSDEELAGIGLNTIIKVRIKNTTNSAEIRFKSCTITPEVTADDIKNTILGLNDTMEYSVDNGLTWTRYQGTFPLNLNGNLTLLVRIAATGDVLAGNTVALKYTTELESNFKEGVLYKIINKTSNKSIDVAGGSGSDNVDIIQYGYHGGANQTAYFVSVGNNEYKIVIKSSGKVLAPKDLSIENGVTLVQTTYSNQDIQKWKLINLGDENYQIINVKTGYAITGKDNRTIINQKLNYTNNQVWNISYAQEISVPNVSFQFEGENAGKIMGSNNSMEYSIDGGVTWSPIKTNDMLLPQTDIIKINAEKNILVRVKGNAGIAIIKISKGIAAPNVKSDDNADIINGIDETMEYSIDYGETWIPYSKTNTPKFKTDMVVFVRIAGKGTVLPSEITKVVFTDKIIIPLYGDFDPMNYISTKDAQGNDITSNIHVIDNPVNVNKKGSYVVTYKTTDAFGKEIILKKTVEIVGKAENLSDIAYKSAMCGYSTIKKDSNLNNGLITLNSKLGKRTFKKGLTAHATSEIVYDVAGKGYTNFASFIGIDDIAYNGKGDVIFKVYTDGKLAYESAVMTSKTQYEYIDVDIAGANEVKLVIDSNGSNGYDHSAWAGGKFYAKDSLPIIEAVNVAYEKDDVINFDDILKKVKATDIEDGDISSKVTYTTNYRKGSTGNFDIVFNVTDSDGHKSEKTVKLIIVNSSIYASDTDWKSATSGWRSVEKDTTINGTPLRLWDGEKEITYTKGIGTHANSQIIYDLTDKNYGYFTSYVGGSREGNGNTSVVFEVYVDGKLVENSGLMKLDTPEKFIKVNIAGAKELKLIVNDGGNGNGNDSAIWGDAKFLMAGETVVNTVDTSKLSDAIKQVQGLNKSDYKVELWNVLEEKLNLGKTILNSDEYSQEEINKVCDEIIEAISKLEKFKGEAPIIHAEDVTFESLKDIDFDKVLAKVTAVDTEDGDISSKVTYTTDYKPNNTGNFKITFKVTDNHGNTTTKEVNLIVKDVADATDTTYTNEKTFVYASDVAWKRDYSQQGTTKKNTSFGGTALTLWDGTKDVVYEKGIGAQAISEVIYDLTNTGFNTFTSYIGVDRSADTRGSVIFRIYVDYKLVYASSLMNKDTPMEFIKVNIKDAKEIRLVVENGDSRIASDFGDWADAKFEK